MLSVFITPCTKPTLIQWTTMSTLRSELAFEEKLKDFGLADKKTRFDDKGWKTMGALAVSCGYNPEGVPDAKVTDVIVRHICEWDGAPPREEPVSANNIRQLFWECIQAFIADTRYRHDYAMAMDDVSRPVNKYERK